MVKIAIITIVGYDYDQCVDWSNPEFVPEWKEVTEQEYELLKKFFLQLSTRYISKYKAIKNSPFLDDRVKLIRLLEPKEIDLSIEKALQLAKELEEESLEKEKKKRARMEKRTITMRAKKLKKLQELKKELGEA